MVSVRYWIWLSLVCCVLCLSLSSCGIPASTHGLQGVDDGGSGGEGTNVGNTGHTPPTTIWRELNYFFCEYTGGGLSPGITIYGLNQSGQWEPVAAAPAGDSRIKVALSDVAQYTVLKCETGVRDPTQGLMGGDMTGECQKADFNNDGFVSSADVLMLHAGMYDQGHGSLTKMDLATLDTNEDGLLNQQDMGFVLNCNQQGLVGPEDCSQENCL